MLTPDKVLNTAADIIEKRGHGHHFYMNNDGNVCAVGAIRLACGAPVTDSADPRAELKFHIDVFASTYDDSAAQEARRTLADHLNIDEMVYSVVEWNDIQDKDTVVRALREAAKKTK